MNAFAWFAIGAAVMLAAAIILLLCTVREIGTKVAKNIDGKD